MDTQATVCGNLASDPSLRYTPNGTPVANFGVAVGTRKKDEQGNWGDGPTHFFDVTCWRDLATNVAESLTKGTRVIVTGRLEQQTWESDQGKRSKVQLVADEVGPSLRWATAEVEKASRRDAGEAQRRVEGAFGASSEPF